MAKTPPFVWHVDHNDHRFPDTSAEYGVVWPQFRLPGVDCPDCNSGAKSLLRPIEATGDFRQLLTEIKWPRKLTQEPKVLYSVARRLNALQACNALEIPLGPAMHFIPREWQTPKCPDVPLVSAGVACLVSREVANYVQAIDPESAKQFVPLKAVEYRYTGIEEGLVPVTDRFDMSAFTGRMRLTDECEQKFVDFAPSERNLLSVFRTVGEICKSCGFLSFLRPDAEDISDEWDDRSVIPKSMWPEGEFAYSPLSAGGYLVSDRVLKFMKSQPGGKFITAKKFEQCE